MHAWWPARPAGSRRRRRAGRIKLASAVALATGLTAAGCGGGSGSSGSSSSSTQASLTASQWANRVCGNITTWVNQLQSSANNITSGLSSSDPQRIKTGFVNFLGGAVTATNTMVSGVKAAGFPSAANGRVYAQGLVSGLEGIQSAFVQAQNQAQALPADNPAALNNEGQALINSLDNAGNQVKTSLNSLSQRYPSSDLDAALKNQAACQSLSK
jgi:hypothetical protein